MQSDVEQARAAEAGAYRLALKLTLTAWAIGAIVGGGIGWFVAGMPGVWGALAGASVAGGTAAVTQLGMVIAQGRAPHAFAAIVGGLWIAKMVVLVTLIAVLSRVDALHRGTFGVVVLTLAVITLGIDTVVVRRARVPHVVPGSGPGSR